MRSSLGLTHKHLTRLDKHSSVSQAFTKYDHKKFYNIVPGFHIRAFEDKVNI